MTERIVTGSDGRKYITAEPLLHVRVYEQAELDAAVAAERSRCATIAETLRVNGMPADGRWIAEVIRGNRTVL